MKKILIVDIETSGFNPTRDRIFEVGIVELDLSTGKIAVLLDKVCHEKPISEEEIENAWVVKSGFMDADEIIASVEFKDIAAEIQDLLLNYAGATAFNKQFDFSFLKARGIHIPNELPCPMILSTPICKLEGKGSGYKWPKAQEAYDYFFPDSDYVELHRGADDAFHEAEIVFELFKRGAFTLEPVK